MIFKECFEKLANEKIKTTKQKVSTVPDYDNIILKQLTNDLRLFINNDDIIVKPSVGQGNYADIPWICLLSSNRSISPSAQKGLYIVLLFNKEGDAFYLALSQGFTSFKNMDISSKQRNERIEKTVKYFQGELQEDFTNKYGFSMRKINLGNDISALAKGYILTTIIAKRYEVHSFDESDFYSSLGFLIHEYEEIINHIGNKTYDDVIELISPRENIESLDKALEEIDQVLNGEFIENRDLKKKPIKVSKGDLRPNKYSRLTQERIYKKVDYIKRAKEQHQTGLIGEKLALEIERNRLLDLYLDPELYLKRVSVESDSYGYDLESVDYKNGNLVKIYIEVKASKDYVDNSFFVSKNELEVSKKKQDTYRIFRIFDITSITPKFYVVDGQIEDNFYLDPVTYSARYKFEIKEN